MSVYEQRLRLRNADVDYYRRLRWSALFTLFQEASIAHTEQLGMGREKTLDRGFLWIITLQTARIRRMPVYDDEVVLSSWPGKTMHVFFPRYYRLTGASGELLVEGSALWGLLEQQTRKLIFPEDKGIVIPGVVTGQECPLPRGIKNVPPEQQQEYTVPFSVLDLNGHMNNTRYFDLAQDVLPRDAVERTPSCITVEYSGEAHWGERLALLTAATPNGYFLSGEADRRVFRMQLDYPAP